MSVLLRYSGGAANLTAEQSLGGAISNYVLSAWRGDGLRLLTGVTFVDADGVTAGTYTVVYDATASTLAFNNGPALPAVSGTLTSNNGSIDVTVVAAALPAANVTDTVTLSRPKNQLLPDTYGAAVQYFCYYVWNSGTAAASPVVQVRQASASARVAVGVDPAAVNVAAQTIAAMTQAPTGVSFSESSASVGELPAGAYRAIWLRQTVADDDASCKASVVIR